jgi:hypothetical protein
MRFPYISVRTMEPDMAGEGKPVPARSRRFEAGKSACRRRGHRLNCLT